MFILITFFCLLSAFIGIFYGIGYIVRRRPAYIQRTVIASVVLIFTGGNMFIQAWSEGQFYIINTYSDQPIPACTYGQQYNQTVCNAHMALREQRVKEAVPWLVFPPPLRPDCDTISQEMCRLEQRDDPYHLKIIRAALPALVAGLLTWLGMKGGLEKLKRVGKPKRGLSQSDMEF
jgi:hypothetical protein